MNKHQHEISFCLAYGPTLTAIAACLNAVVDIRLIRPFNTPKYQASQIAVEVFLQLSHLRSISRLGAADHDGSLGGSLASHRATRHFGAEALNSCGGTARIGQFGLQGFVLVLCFRERGRQLVGESLRFG